MKDLRTLCDKAIQLWDADCDMDGVINEMRATLAQPEPEGPTFIEVMQLADDFFTFRGNSHGGAFFATEITAKTDPGLALEQFAHAVLTRWGRLSIEPVPVSKRLPGPEDCDKEGQCWWYHPETFNCVASWCHSRSNGTEKHWLPHHALPVPAPSSEEN
jgi:hypothetical protein